MSQIAIIGFFSLTSVLAFLWSLTPYTYFTPQLLALIGLITVIFIKKRFLFYSLISLLINLIIFSTGGVHSPFFFLAYFLLFLVAFQYQSATALSVSLIQIILYSQSLDSASSLLPLSSLLFIAPFSWFISRQHQTLSQEETDILLWLNLKFKTGIKVIINSTRDPHPDLKEIRSSAVNLLNSADKLTDEFQDDL
jgi:hypothetical protein